jgi:L-alanine-DL-glutamate epimerase-like enolase superfamily enzyme
MLVAGGKMIVPDRPGLGLTLSEQAAAWTVDRTAIGPGA